MVVLGVMFWYNTQSAADHQRVTIGRGENWHGSVPLLYKQNKINKWTNTYKYNSSFSTSKAKYSQSIIKTHKNKFYYSKIHWRRLNNCRNILRLLWIMRPIYECIQQPLSETLGNSFFFTIKSNWVVLHSLHNTLELWLHIPSEGCSSNGVLIKGTVHVW